jgi:NAD(P)-dependent dehydrogenase (short-subunit alcohol dehydrogenase family)
MTRRMEGRRVLMTGVSRGIGFEATRLLLGEGAEVLGVARDPERRSPYSRRDTSPAASPEWTGRLDHLVQPFRLSAPLHGSTMALSALPSGWCDIPRNLTGQL